MKKLILRFLLAILLAVIVVFALKYKTIKRLNTVNHLFDEDKIVYNFQNMANHVEVSTLEPSENPTQFPKRLDYELIENFTYDDSVINVMDYWNYTTSEGLMILHKDTIVFEKYDNGLTPSTTHISWSMAKSVVATLLGIAYDQGLFKLDEPVTKYLPQFKDTGYDGVKIKDILQMSSGVGFNEDYGDFNSDINRFGRAFALGTSFEKFSMSLDREREPGTYNHYVSIDTQVLGLLLAKLTGKSLTAYLEEKLWEPLGMQDKAEWIIDNTGFELALGGLNMSLRDYAKIGQLYLHKGVSNGKQIVSENWIKMATTPDAPHVTPGPRENASQDFGYGFQWWIPYPDDGDFFAVGIYNQFIYVQPEADLVITKLSSNWRFRNETENSKKIHLSLFKTIAQDFIETTQDTITYEQAN